MWVVPVSVSSSVIQLTVSPSSVSVPVARYSTRYFAAPGTASQLSGTLVWVSVPTVRFAGAGGAPCTVNVTVVVAVFTSSPVPTLACTVSVYVAAVSASSAAATESWPPAPAMAKASPVFPAVMVWAIAELPTTVAATVPTAVPTAASSATPKA